MTEAELHDLLERHTRPGSPPLCPEIVTREASHLVPIWEEAERLAGREVEPPYWAYSWHGSQALARYVLDHSDLVQGRRVVDVGTGGGIVAIAAALAGAGHVTAVDIEPYAIEAARLNAAANGVALDLVEGDPVGTDEGWDVVLAGDVWYEAELADHLGPWLRGLAARGATVLTGDLGRAHLSADGLEELARYVVPTLVDLEDVPEKTARVLRLLPASAGT